MNDNRFQFIFVKCSYATILNVKQYENAFTHLKIHAIFILFRVNITQSYRTYRPWHTYDSKILHFDIKSLNINIYML